MPGSSNPPGARAERTGSRGIRARAPRLLLIVSCGTILAFSQWPRPLFSWNGVFVEYPATPQQGMQYRLWHRGAGMLFIGPHLPPAACFWNDRVPVPLHLTAYNSARRPIASADLRPFSRRTWCPPSGTTAVLECVPWLCKANTYTAAQINTYTAANHKPALWLP